MRVNQKSVIEQNFAEFTNKTILDRKIVKTNNETDWFYRMCKRSSTFLDLNMMK